MFFLGGILIAPRVGLANRLPLKVLWCLMNSLVAAQSNFDFDDLEYYGWESADMGGENAMNAYRDHVNDLYTGFGFNKANDNGWGFLHFNEWPADADPDDQNEVT